MLEPSDIRDAVIALLRGIGAVVASAVYLGGVMAWALVVHDKPMMVSAVVAAGLTYLGYFVQIVWPDQRVVSFALVTASIAFGLLAGLIGLIFN